MAKKKLKDLPRSSSRTKTIGQDPLMKAFHGIPLRKSHPGLACEYKDLGPYSVDDIPAGSNRVVRWLHERCGQYIEVAINIRARAWDEGTKDQGCYICAGRSPKPKPPQVIPKWLQREIVADSKRAIRIQDISPWSQSYWLFKCPLRTGFKYSSRIMDRLNPFSQEPKQGCPCDKCCHDERVNLLAESVARVPGRPDVWNMFIRTSENIGFSPERLPINHRVRWKCEKNRRHRFSRSLTELYDDGCPSCAKENDESSLAAPKYRQLAREFLFVPSDPELTPINIKPGSNVVAAFRCSEGHTFRKAVCRRTQPKPENCPYCAGKRSDAPSLISVSPYILKRWHPDNNTNQYPLVGGVAQAYNANGCLTSDGVWSHGYDTENHLLTSSKAGTSLAFVYDPFHRQAEKTATVAGTTKTRYVYSGWQRLADYDSVTDTLQNRYVYGTHMDEPLIQVSSAGVLTFLHANHQGSIIATTDSTGAVTNKNAYGPFGETAALAGTTFGYTAQRFDSESGLYYYKRRYFSSATGRFLQPDPIGYQIEVACGCSCAGGCGDDAKASQLNLYQYVENDPLNLQDPLGLQAATMTGTAIAPGPGTAVGIAIDVAIALGLAAAAVAIGEAAAEAADPYWRRLRRSICRKLAMYALNQCLDEAAKFPCPEDAELYREIAGAFTGQSITHANLNSKR